MYKREICCAILPVILHVLPMIQTTPLVPFFVEELVILAKMKMIKVQKQPYVQPRMKLVSLKRQTSLLGCSTCNDNTVEAGFYGGK